MGDRGRIRSGLTFFSASVMDASLRSKLRQARVGRLATADREARPHIVPVCFAYDGRFFYTALDLKSKRVAPEKLARVRNIRANPSVALLVDAYREDWRKLWYVLIRGKSKILTKGKEHQKGLRLLRKKYPQYEKGGFLEEHPPIIRITPVRMVSWGDS